MSHFNLFYQVFLGKFTFCLLSLMFPSHDLYFPDYLVILSAFCLFAHLFCFKNHFQSSLLDNFFSYFSVDLISYAVLLSESL